MDASSLPAVGALVLADCAFAPGRFSREAVRVVRVLDPETVLVTVLASVATPALLIGGTFPIPTAKVVGPLPGAA